jgi:hypothetical protein
MILKNFLFVMLAFLFTANSLADEKITRVSRPNEVSVEVSKYRGVPKELESLVWNRWTSKNFVVCSLNDSQAQYLHKHLELVKSWMFLRWGMKDIDFSTTCKLICVEDKELFKKLFNIENTKVEIRRDENKKITETVIFLLIDGTPSQTVPVPLTQICLAEFSQKFRVDFKTWIYKGFSHLNDSLIKIRENLNKLEDYKNNNLLTVKDLVDFDNEKYKQLKDEDKKIFDCYSMYLCLMVRKEFGEDLFLNFIQECSKENFEYAIKNVLKFDSVEHFDKSFQRYLKDLSNDVKLGKTPNYYLQINSKDN